LVSCGSISLYLLGTVLFLSVFNREITAFYSSAAVSFLGFLIYFAKLFSSMGLLISSTTQIATLWF